MDLGAIESKDGRCKRLMDQGALDGAKDGACDGVLSNRRSDAWRKRWISEQVKAQWILQAGQLKVL